VIPPSPPQAYILGMRVDATSYADATGRALWWARRQESRYICVANAHAAMECYHSRDYRRAVNGADLVTPDGMPLVWGLRLLGAPAATRVYGPDLTVALLEAAAREDLPVGFYGGTPATVDRLLRVLSQRLPQLKPVFAMSPPFRPATADEDRRIVAQINRSGARLLFVGLGCPKQERWMAEHAGRISAVMIGVGAAFDFLAGVKRQAPRWMQRSGLEWSFRLCSEPRRLWRRYLWYGPQFVALFLWQVMGRRMFPMLRPWAGWHR
jgi:N-acetylglucosaminyldiphosphoundecaprenol N-acetyl-beta-D-mannosaminyltransferase